MIKKISFAFLVVLALHFSCTSFDYQKINVELPGIATLDIDQFQEIVISDFLVEKETKDFDINQELIDSFSTELSKHFLGKISTKEMSWEEKDIFHKEDFWKSFVPDQEEALILTGSVQYSEEIRKAILEDHSSISERHYPTKKGLAQRKFYTLILNLYLIKAKTGEVFYTRDFKESKGYKNPKQTAIFAFFDLIETVKGKFLQNVVGKKKLAQRYLISE
ncbi:hypothetical protein AMJ44_00325 [candidate division WOR-1 bacterium DG_54_3]|uniref:Lipoprotein n=1 Tax=candidate division WOR-1 bacterium DG_54_3 TaxID=1703775 RepID=A0A0S7Y7J3_UNCSA|nr:MAG: hypothetical protein AMJ44_00325 [candidate division WOR-1 bacterium DG_54_3]